MDEGPTAPYELYRRGLRLMRTGSPAAAAEVLGRLVAEVPESRSAREALGRALFRAGRFADSRAAFDWIAERDPADDYAHFGAGLAARRVGDLDGAAGHLAMAVALRPERAAYREALEESRRARAARAS